MRDIVQIGNSVWTSGGRENNVLMKKLPDEIGGKPAAVLGFRLDIDARFTCAAAGLGITGKRLFDIIKAVTVKYDNETWHNSIPGGVYRIHQLSQLGKPPFIPADTAIAAGATTRRLRIYVPLTDLGLTRQKDNGVPVAQLKKDGSINFVWQDTNGLGNANDSITALTAMEVSAIVVPFDEGETGGRLKLDVQDYNGKKDFEVASGRYRYLFVVPDTAGTMFTAAEMTRLTSKVGGQDIHTDIPLRNLVDQYNEDRGIDPDSRQFAPEDAALGSTDFLPVFFPQKGEPASGIPAGDVRLAFDGTKVNYKVFTVHVEEVDDATRKTTLKAMGYDAKEVDNHPVEGKVPKTLRPGLEGHVNMNPRKRMILPQTWQFLKTRSGKKVRD